MYLYRFLKTKNLPNYNNFCSNSTNDVSKLGVIVSFLVRIKNNGKKKHRNKEVAKKACKAIGEM